jgi:hypothetical protein
MPDFVAATSSELAALRAMRVAHRLLRRVEVRIALHRARVRVARTLKAARDMRTVTDLRFQASVTEREARSLQTLADAVRGRRTVEKALKRALDLLDVKL